jgi:hypothetical protein
MQAAYMALMEQLREAQGEAYEMDEALRAANRKIAELEEAARLRASVVYDREAYWTGESRKIGPDGPFCTRCLDGDGVLMRLKRAHGGHALCPQKSCGGLFFVWPEKEPRDRQRGMISRGLDESPRD